jgi:hypothetical protein
MRDVCSLIWLAMIGLFRSRASRQAEILTLRHQLNVLRRKSPRRLSFTSIDRLVFAGLYRLAPGVLHRWPFATKSALFRRLPLPDQLLLRRNSGHPARETFNNNGSAKSRPLG